MLFYIYAIYNTSLPHDQISIVLQPAQEDEKGQHLEGNIQQNDHLKWA